MEVGVANPPFTSEYRMSKINVEKFHALGRIRSLDRESRVPLTSMALNVGLYMTIAITN
jgi:hypothetical protein